MMIRYVDPDPRAGREVRLADELAQRLIDAGRAEQITDPSIAAEKQAAKAEGEASEPAHKTAAHHRRR